MMRLMSTMPSPLVCDRCSLQHPDERAGLFDDEPSPRLVGWARALTLAEETIPGCEGGAKSPVIALARLLRSRGDYPHDLTLWIKRVSSNRFLPYGSLMDRL